MKPATVKEADVIQFENDMRCFFFKPYPWQVHANQVVHEKNIAAAVCSNKIGKSCWVSNEAIAWCLGYEPWKQYDKGAPDRIEIEGVWYKRSSLGIEPPVTILLVGEDWKTHIGRTLIPELKKWAPKGWYTTKRNVLGVEADWEWMNGSKLHVMSYKQDDDLFESFRVQGVIFDEPPPKSKATAVSRGLMLDQGKTLYSLTPLKEPWILDDIVLSERKDIGVIKDLSLMDNPDLVRDDRAVLKKMGLDKIKVDKFFNLLLYGNFERKGYVKDQGKKAVKFLEEVAPDKVDDLVGRLRILKFIRDIDPSDVPARVFGMFASLVGRVLKSFDKDVHVIQPFEIPCDWPVVVMIDFHLSTRQAMSYWTVDKYGMEYCIREVWEHYSPEEIADDIIRQKKTKGWNIEEVFIDPLSKGDTQYMKNRAGEEVEDSFSIIYNLLVDHGITLDIGSKDKVSGIKNIETKLKGRNGRPTVFIFEDCDRHLYEVNRWVYDENDLPMKENDHFMENWYRFTLTGTKYQTAPKPSPAIGKVTSGGSGAWMGT